MSRPNQTSRFSDFRIRGAPEFIRVSKWLAASAFALMILFGCGDPPGAPPEQLRGNVLITGVLPDDSLPDSIQIILDEIDTLGIFANHHLCENVLAGIHKIEVNVEVGNIEYFGSSTAIVQPSETSQIEVLLLGIAPDFVLTDIEGDTISMSALSGKVVLLYFFSST